MWRYASYVRLMFPVSQCERTRRRPITHPRLMDSGTTRASSCSYFGDIVLLLYDWGPSRRSHADPSASPPRL